MLFYQQNNQYGSQHNINNSTFGLQQNAFGSSPHIPNDRQQISSSPHRHRLIEPPQFYLHDQQQQVQSPPMRRTWAQQNQDQSLWQGAHALPHQQTQNQDLQRGWSAPQMVPGHPQELRTWGNPHGFILHEGQNPSYNVNMSNVNMSNVNVKYQNGSEHQNHILLSSPHTQQSHFAVQSLFNQQTPPAASPQHRVITPQRQQSLVDLPRQLGAVSLQQLSSNDTVHVPIKAPSIDDMEPQNISFIGNAEDEALQQGISRLNITSGSRTYRIPSPTRPSLTRNSFQQPLLETSPSGNSLDQVDQSAEKGFYISFDSEQPKRPKPPLRVKRGSPKKDRTPSNNHSPERESHDTVDESHWQDRVKLSNQEPLINQKHISVDSIKPIVHKEIQSSRTVSSEEAKNNAAAIIIGKDISNLNPVSSNLTLKILENEYELFTYESFII